MNPSPEVREGRLSARPRQSGDAEGAPLAAPAPPLPPGVALHLPAGHTGAIRLVVLLHGAGGTAAHGLSLLADQADEHGLALLAPKAASSTWDVIRGGYGPDVTRLDGALTHVFAQYDVASVAIGGFSDGASYALSLGVANGDLFSAIVAFSPGFMAPAVINGRPRILLTHGSDDEVLPIERCGRRVAAQLRRAGYDLDYREFDGGHVVTPQLRADAARWLVGPH